MESPKQPGRIITFYSYKGGTGRSMALANVAWLLAAAGKRVLIIDWDLEAPGLHRYVHPFLDDPSVASSEGVIDFVISYTEEASSKKLNEELDPKWYATYANITRFAIPLDYDFPSGGTLDFIPAGKHGPAYAGRVNSFNWKDFYINLGGRAVLKEAAERMRAGYEFILIDSRTGVSDTSGICTVEMPDDVAVCFTLNVQSVSGAAAAARSMLEQRPPDRPLNVFPVAMRVVDAELEKTLAVREYAKREFLPLMNDAAVPAGARDEYWHEVEVRQISYYAFEEQLAYFRDPPNDPASVLASMKRLAWRCTGVDVRGLPGPDAAVRDEILAVYAGVWGKVKAAQPEEPARRFVYVSYANPPALRAAASIVATAIPSGAEAVTAAEVPHNGAWPESFRGILRRSAGMVVVAENQFVGPNQQRELAIAFDHQSRAGGRAAFPITAVSASGTPVYDFPALAPPDRGALPYPGLRPFQVEDSPVYFGPDAFIQKLAQQMQTAPLIVLGGRPGTGKTSLVQAGLFPALLRLESPRWKVARCDISKGRTQVALPAIAEALVRLRGTAQFEEQVQKEAAELVARLPKEGSGLLKETVASALAVWPPADRLAILIEAGSSVVDSSYAFFRDIPSVCFLVLVEAAMPGELIVPPLSRDELIRTIEQPAAWAGVTLESSLAARIADDLEGHAQPLALLQFCMARLWDTASRADGHMIRLQDYEAIGGAANAVELLAERMFTNLGASDQQPALRLMCRMAPVSPDGGAAGRQLDEAEVPPSLRYVVGILIENRLIQAETVNGHKFYSLFPLAFEWPRLRDAITANAEFLNWRSGFQVPQTEGTAQGRYSYSALLRDDALAAAQRYLADRPEDFTEREVDFIRRSEEQAREVDRRRSKPQRSSPAPSTLQKSRSWIGISVAVLGLVIGLFEFNFKRSSPGELLTAAYHYSVNQDYSHAIADLSNALQHRPDPSLLPEIYSLRAYCYKLMGDWQKSLADLNSALNAEPAGATKNKVGLLIDRGYAYRQLKQPALALADYTAALALDPSSKDALENQQQIERMLKKTK